MWGKMIGKKVPIKEGSFRIEVSNEEMEELHKLKRLSQGPAPSFFAEWMREITSEKPRESSIEEIPLTIYEVDDDYNPTRVFETTVKSASMTIDGRNYDIPLDMAITALQNMDENSEISYKETKDEN